MILTEIVTCMEFSPDSLELWTGHLDGTIRVWDLKTYNLVSHLGEHIPENKVIQLCCNQYVFASLTKNGSCYLWDSSDYQLLYQLSDNRLYPLNYQYDDQLFATQICFTSDNKSLLVCTFNGLHIWNLKDKKYLDGRQLIKPLVNKSLLYRFDCQWDHHLSECDGNIIIYEPLQKCRYDSSRTLQMHPYCYNVTDQRYIKVLKDCFILANSKTLQLRDFNCFVLEKIDDSKHYINFAATEDLLICNLGEKINVRSTKTLALVSEISVKQDSDMIKLKYGGIVQLSKLHLVAYCRSNNNSSQIEFTDLYATFLQYQKTQCWPKARWVYAGYYKNPQSDFYKIPKDILNLILWNLIEDRKSLQLVDPL
jgi:hypothetical protein